MSSNKNNSFKTVSKQPTGAKIIAYFIVIFVCLCAVLSAVFSGVLLYQNNKKSASADEIQDTGLFLGSNVTFMSQLAFSTYMFGSSPTIDRSELRTARAYINFNVGYLNMGVSNLGTVSESYNFRLYFRLNSTQVSQGLPNEGLPLYYRLPARTSSTLMSYDSNYGMYFIDYSLSDDNNNLLNMSYSATGDYSNPDGFIQYYDSFFFVETAGNASGVPFVFVSCSNKLGSVIGVREFSFIDNPGNLSSRYTYQCLQYFDSEGNFLLVGTFALTTADSYNFYLYDRTYYFPSYVESSSVDASASYGQGSVEGYNKGYNEGYHLGYSRGDNAGYNRGKTDGIAQANDYSFIGLLGAVVDAPVRAFSSLLNFNLLGFNMLNFFTGLLTLSLILWIIGKILGGK